MALFILSIFALLYRSDDAIKKSKRMIIFSKITEPSDIFYFKSSFKSLSVSDLYTRWSEIRNASIFCQIFYRGVLDEYKKFALFIGRNNGTHNYSQEHESLWKQFLLSSNFGHQVIGMGQNFVKSSTVACWTSTYSLHFASEGIPEDEEKIRRSVQRFPPWFTRIITTWTLL